MIADREYLKTYKSETLQAIIDHDEKVLKTTSNGSLAANIKNKIETCRGLLKERLNEN